MVKQIEDVIRLAEEWLVDAPAMPPLWWRNRVQELVVMLREIEADQKRVQANVLAAAGLDPRVVD